MAGSNGWYSRLKQTTVRRREAFLKQAYRICMLCLLLLSALLVLYMSVTAFRRAPFRPLLATETESSNSIISDHDMCDRNNEGKCRQPGIFHSLQGFLSSRIYALCLVDSYSALVGTTARHVWAQEGMLSMVKFEDLLDSEAFDIRLDDGIKHPDTYIKIQFPDPSCGANEVEREDQTLPAVTAFVDGTLGSLNGSKSCELAAAMDRCFRKLKPSRDVGSLVKRENMKKIEKTVGVYSHAGILNEYVPRDWLPDPLPECLGCMDFRLLNCTLRRVTMEFLHNRDSDFTVVGQWPSDAITLHQSFEPSRAPHALEATRARMDSCPRHPDSVIKWIPPRNGSKRHPHGGEASRRFFMNMEMENRRRGRAKWLARNPGSHRGLMESSNSTIGPIGSDLGMPLLCIQLELAELFLLGYTKGLIYSFDSAATRFILARIARSEGNSEAVVGSNICREPRISPIHQQKFSQQMYVNEDLKVIYCSIQKVASTSWKLWFRQVAHLPDENNTWIAHDPDVSGLKELWYKYSEAAAIRVATRRDMFKFAFVRNPYSRMASVYLDKHVDGGPRYSRAYWTKKFFRLLRNRHHRLKFADLMDFEKFTQLVQELSIRARLKMDPHIAPQVDLCGLDFVQYDFIGRFESVEDDVAAIMKRLGTQPLSAFSVGKWYHFTNSSEQLVGLYTKMAYTIVKRVFSMDLSIPFNNITYEAPKELAAKFENLA